MHSVLTVQCVLCVVHGRVSGYFYEDESGAGVKTWRNIWGRINEVLTLKPRLQLSTVQCSTYRV